MTGTDFDARYGQYAQAVERYLDGLFLGKAAWADLYEAMRYSLLAGGKRIRPVLTLEFSRLSGLDWQAALPAACALELVHTYSLIHDDLPCMDDDNLRRGKPTNHKVYGETLAVLAGDALQPEAYRLILTAPALSPERRAECALVLAKASGADGMVAGQVLDTLHAPNSEAALEQVHRLKTGAMLAGACTMGVTAAGGDAKLRRAAEEYGTQLGLAFQIRDDLLDVVGNAETFGKPIGSDRKEGKVTYADLLGLSGCEAAIRTATERAAATIQAFDSAGFLIEMARQLAKREK